MEITFIKVRDLNEAWWKCIREVLTKGYEYTIDAGSYAGQKRKEFDLVCVQITNPNIRPLVPLTPEGVPAPTTIEYVEKEYLPYLMTSIKPDEKTLYTYGSYIEPQYNQIIKMFKEEGFENNRCCMTIGSKDSVFYEHSECLRLIDCRIRYGKLHYIVYFRSWDLFCLSSDTLILTEIGWKDYRSMTYLDKVATFNLTTKQIEFQHPIMIHQYNYSGNMCHISNTRLDQLVTPNHKVLFKRSRHSGSKSYHGNFEYEEAAKLDFGSRYISIPIAPNKTEGYFSIGENFARLLGWVISEGHYHNKCNEVIIYQSEKNIKYVNEIRELLNVLGFSFYEYKTKPRSQSILGKPAQVYSPLICFNIHAKFGKIIRRALPNKKPDWKLLHILSNERQALLDSLIKGDGCVDRLVFYQKDIYTRQFVIALALTLGYSAAEHTKNISVIIKRRKYTQLRKSYGHRVDLLPYDGIVWSVTVPQGNYIAMRNGKPFITGNSGFPANLAGIQLMKEAMANELGVEDGELIAFSKGLHLYFHFWGLGKAVVGL